MLGTPLMGMRFWKPDSTFYLSTILIYTLGVIAVFENPWISDPRIHADVWDVPFYLVGMAIYWKWINPPRASRNVN